MELHMSAPFSRRRLSYLGAVVAAALSAACHSQDATGLPPEANGLLTPGEVATAPSGVRLDVAGGPNGGEYLLVVADTATSGSAASAFQIAASGTASAGSVSRPSTALIPTPASPSLGTAAAVRGPELDVGFGARLNERARRRLRPLFPSARSALVAPPAAGLSPAGPRASTARSSVQVGDVVTYNVGQDACDTIVSHPARIVAVGSKAIVAVDTLNPAGGFTAADYQRFAATFDTLVYPLDVANFGEPQDIDGNGHVVLLFTRAVNELTKRSSESYVGGFFFARDLFPKASTATLQACRGSNVGEMFYLLAPDPAGTINGNARSAAFVDGLLTGLLGHEFQHLINASRRIYVNDANDLEDVWLNEGLSHVAEELLFYRQARLAPQGNIDVATLRASATARNAFNADQSANAARYELYLQAPSKNSPIRNDDSLATRGATWDLLRYSADRKIRSGGGQESDIWQALVNSKAVGIANLRAVFGSNVGGLLRDWSVSQYVDDAVTDASADYLQPSWNWHSVYSALTDAGTYPLAVTTLPTTGMSGSVIPGGAAFYRFAVPANGTASITLSGGSRAGPAIGTVIRLR
jgi:hypothetical protein